MYNKNKMCQFPFVLLVFTVFNLVVVCVCNRAMYSRDILCNCNTVNCTVTSRLPHSSTKQRKVKLLGMNKMSKLRVEQVLAISYLPNMAGA